MRGTVQPFCFHLSPKACTLTAYIIRKCMTGEKSNMLIFQRGEGQFPKSEVKWSVLFKYLKLQRSKTFLIVYFISFCFKIWTVSWTFQEVFCKAVGNQCSKDCFISTCHNTYGKNGCIQNYSFVVYFSM